jgi:hypothetical protein
MEEGTSVLSSLAKCMPTCFTNWMSDFLNLFSPTACTKNIEFSVTTHCTTAFLTIKTNVENVLYNA